MQWMAVETYQLADLPQSVITHHISSQLMGFIGTFYPRTAYIWYWMYIVTMIRRLYWSHCVTPVLHQTYTLIAIFDVHKHTSEDLQVNTFYNNLTDLTTYSIIHLYIPGLRRQTTWVNIAAKVLVICWCFRYRRKESTERLSKVSFNEIYRCNTFSLWHRPYLAINRKRTSHIMSQINDNRNLNRNHIKMFVLWMDQLSTY